MNKIIALVGLPGSGKTEVANYLKNHNFLYLRFGQIVLDEVLRRGKVSEKVEREVRNGFRVTYGPAALAILNIPKLDELLLKGNVVADGLYSWEEYKTLKQKYGDEIIKILAIVASSKTRHDRLSERKLNPNDTKAVYRALTKEEAVSRDFDQIEKLNQGGPIAMADYFIINEGSKENLVKDVDTILNKFI